MGDITTRHTCLRLDLIGEDPKAKNVVFVKGTWFASRFDISISDGLRAWSCQASETEVKMRAEQWDQSVGEYVELVERYLGFQQPGSVYRFEDAENGQRRLSFTFEKHGVKLEWRWKCAPAPDDKKITITILDFLMDANIRLSEEVVRKTQSCEKLKTEAQKCLEQCEMLATEKKEFENAAYAKFVTLLNSKKAKLRELRDRISKLESSDKHPEGEEEGSTDKTESFDEVSDEEGKVVSDLPSTSKRAAASSSKGQKRKMQK